VCRTGAIERDVDIGLGAARNLAKQPTGKRLLDSQDFARSIPGYNARRERAQLVN
jgi:hypothetical protein